MYLTNIVYGVIQLLTIQEKNAIKVYGIHINILKLTDCMYGQRNGKKCWKQPQEN